MRARIAPAHRRAAGQIFRFAMTTATSAAVTLGLPVFLHEILGINQRVAVAFGQATVFFVNFLLIRMFVFRSSNRPGRQFLHYAGSAVVFRTLEYVAFLLLLDWAGLFYVFALLITLGTSTLIKFVWYRFLFGGHQAAAI